MAKFFSVSKNGVVLLIISKLCFQAKTAMDCRSFGAHLCAISLPINFIFLSPLPFETTVHSLVNQGYIPPLGNWKDQQNCWNPMVL
jgi:hypothetical protein